MTPSNDLFPPCRNDCRACHLGVDTAGAKVSFGCAICNGYHAAGADSASVLGQKEQARRNEPA